MNKYIFDTNTLIGLGQRHYPQDIFPDLWAKIFEEISNGAIIITDGVIDELKEKIDDTTANQNSWREPLILAAEQTTQIKHENFQSEYALMANKCYVDRQYRGDSKIASVSRFLSKADVWLVSIAKAEDCILVSEESDGSLKIPRICRLENVMCIKSIDYFRSLGLTFTS